MPLLMCPNCNTSMQEVNRSGVQIDMCPVCRGVWLDRGELEKIVAPLREAASHLDDAPPARREDAPPPRRETRPMRDDEDRYGRGRDDDDRRRSRYDDDDDDDDNRRGRGRRRGGIFDLLDIFD